MSRFERLQAKGAVIEASPPVCLSSYDPTISVWQQREWDRAAQKKRRQERERQRREAQAAKQLKRCTADNVTWGQCETPGAIRTNPADGAELGRLCMRHFRERYPAIAPPALPKPPKPGMCPCGYGQRWQAWTYCPGCGERLPEVERKEA